MGIFSSLLTWTQETLQPLGAWGLFVLAFIESSFFPIPPDILLIVLALEHPDLALFFALITTVGSVLGGMFGYGIGYVGGKAVLEKFMSHNKIQRVHDLFNKYESWTIGIAGFTPIPYKVFTIAAGVFYINFWKFVVMSLLSRGARFFLEAVLIMFFGAQIVIFIDTYFGPLSLLVVVVLALGLYMYKRKKFDKTTQQKRT